MIASSCSKSSASVAPKASQLAAANSRRFLLRPRGSAAPRSSPATAESTPRSRSLAAPSRWRSSSRGRAHRRRSRGTARPVPARPLRFEHFRQLTVVRLQRAAACRFIVRSDFGSRFSRGRSCAASQSRPVHCISRAGASATRLRQRYGKTWNSRNRWIALSVCTCRPGSVFGHELAERLDEPAVLHARTGTPSRTPGS